MNSEASSASKRLLECKESILREFLAEIERELPVLRGQTRIEKADSLPQFVDFLAKRIVNEADPAVLLKLEELGRIHATQRFGIVGYSLNQVLTEYRILRRLICASVFGDRIQSRQVVEAIHDSIDRAVTQAGAHFLEISKRKIIEAEEKQRRAKEEAQKAAAHLDLQAKTMDTILSALPDIVFLIDRDRRITYANASLLKLWGKSMEESRGKNLKELGYPDHLIRLHESQMDQVFRTKAGITGENAYRAADGETGYFENIFVPIIGSDGEVTCIAGAARDVTHRRSAEEALKRAVLNREEVLAVVSHDLRNPLGAILMTVAMLKRMPNRGPEFVQEQILKIQRAGERMNDLIEDLLNLAKIEAGHFNLNKQEICGCNVVLEAVETVKSRAEEKRIRIETQGTDQPLRMSCDHGMVLRVFANLIGNAIKFTPEDGLIVVSAEDRGSEVLFRVTDTGPGIAEHHLSNIFDRFWQAKQTAHLGTGLGLAIAKGIVEAHGGRIWVDSKFGYGASFYFTLPKAGVVRRDSAA